MDKRLRTIISAWERLNDNQRNLIHHQAMFALAFQPPHERDRLWHYIGEPAMLGERRAVHLIGGHAWRRATDQRIAPES